MDAVFHCDHFNPRDCPFDICFNNSVYREDDIDCEFCEILR